MYSDLNSIACEVPHLFSRLFCLLEDLPAFLTLIFDQIFRSEQSFVA